MAEKTEQQAGGEAKGRLTLSRDMVWPVIIIVALILVVVVNAIFIYIAVTGADEVAPSYTEGQR